MKKRRTKFIKKTEVKREKYVVDATGKILGRLASKVAVYLRGKHKPIYTPQTDCGDFITVINADKVAISGKKTKAKTYFTHSGYPGGDKLLSFEKMMEKGPAKVVQLAIRGMLPHSRLGEAMFTKLRVYVGENSQYKNWAKLEV